MKKIMALALALLFLAGSTATAGQNRETVIAVTELSGNYNPFYARTAGDLKAVNLTQAGMMTTDREGRVIHKGISGETVSYKGREYTYYGTGDLQEEYEPAEDITTYTFRLRNDLHFADGKTVTADDIIFNYYVYLDPSYKGPNLMNIYPIIGAEEYRTQLTEENRERVLSVVRAIRAAGFGYRVGEEDLFTQEQYDSYYENAKELWMTESRKSAEFAYENYTELFEERLGCSREEIGEDEGLKAALALAVLGYGKAENGILTLKNGNSYDLKNGKRPGWTELFDASFEAYDGDIEFYLSCETEMNTDDIAAKLAARISRDEDGGVPNIAGITKKDDKTVEVRMKGNDPDAVYTVLGMMIAPLHYYGDTRQYDYDKNLFGHPFGDLSKIEKQEIPMGAGPYRMVQKSKGTAAFSGNPFYYLGKPKINELLLKEMKEADMIPAIEAGEADAGEIGGDLESLNALKSLNGNGQVSGDRIKAIASLRLGYGYIGINAGTVNVDGEPGSRASVSLRRALATILSLYRESAVMNYYGETAEVIDYPISLVYGTAPEKGENGYREAFSADSEGSTLYTDGMTFEEKESRATEAAVEYLKEAGYSWDEDQGLFTAAPQGASMSYRITVPGDGKKDHACYEIAENAAKALAGIGISLVIDDPEDVQDLYEEMAAGTQELWCAAWGSTVKPDPELNYRSENAIGAGGKESNYFRIQSGTLDRLIDAIHTESDSSTRKELYRVTMEEVLKWAVEIPVYQRQTYTLFSAERIDVSSVTPDITPVWGWVAEIQNLQRKK